MPRTLQITVPSERSSELLQILPHQPGILGLQLQQGVSIQPPGDVITVQVLNRHLPAILDRLQRLGIAADQSSTLLTSELASVVSPPKNNRIVNDSAEGSWEEMEATVARGSNMTLNALLLMLTAGFIAAAGMRDGALHLLVAAMLIAPGFEPLLRISLNLANGGRMWRRGLTDSLKAYAVLCAGALAGFGLLGPPSPSAAPPYLPAPELIAFWSTVSPASLLVSGLAAAAGAMLIVTTRAVLTAGVMVALALIPSPVLAMLGILEGDAALALRAGARFAVEILLVTVVSLAVFGWKRLTLQRRRALW